jgi:hypothetical protein
VNYKYEDVPIYKIPPHTPKSSKAHQFQNTIPVRGLSHTTLPIMAKRKRAPEARGATGKRQQKSREVHLTPTTPAVAPNPGSKVSDKGFVKREDSRGHQCVALWCTRRCAIGQRKQVPMLFGGDPSNTKLARKREAVRKAWLLSLGRRDIVEWRSSTNSDEKDKIKTVWESRNLECCKHHLDPHTGVPRVR